MHSLSKNVYGKRCVEHTSYLQNYFITAFINRRKFTIESLEFTTSLLSKTNHALNVSDYDFSRFKKVLNLGLNVNRNEVLTADCGSILRIIQLI